jgi:hypothetical protein
MQASDSLRRIARRKKFFPVDQNPNYLERVGPTLCILKITDFPDGSFNATYFDQCHELSYHGNFGPKGGKTNYAARRIVELLSG